MTADLVVRGGTLVTSDGEARLALAISDGRIVAVDRDEAMPAARETVDATGWHILPGVIDTHVHLREPGHPEREDWLTGTRAAAAGGITTILEMPISVPPVHTAAILRERAALVQPRSLVDFGLYGGASADNLEHIEAMAEAGAVAFKTFRTRAPVGREQEFVGICCPDAGRMWEVMERTARTRRLHVVHAEDQQILDVATARVRASGNLRGRAHAQARPEIAEVASVAQCIALAAATGTRLQIAHMSTAAAARLVAQAKDAGLPVTAETCPHYLTFTEHALDEWGPFAKCDPPLRSPATQQGLWEAVRAGIVDVIGTDHAPFHEQEKAPFFDNVLEARSGIIGLEQHVPVLLTAVAGGKLTLRALVRMVSETPARLFGLWPRKGRIAVGADADLTVVDLSAEWVHDHRHLHSKARATARIYDGMRFRGLPVMTVVRGRIVMRQGRIEGTPGWGQWIRPE
jgi:allantoinase